MSNETSYETVDEISSTFYKCNYCHELCIYAAFFGVKLKNSNNLTEPETTFRRNESFIMEITRGPF